MLILAGFIILAVAFNASAEESVEVTEDSAAVQSMPKDTSETQWAWGEVTNLDLSAQTFTLKYLDYETDQEKDIVLTVDEKTAFENIKRLDEVKIKDTLSVDYMVDTDGKNIAKNINFEKSDASSAASPVAVEAAAVTQASASTASVEAPVLPPVEIFVPLDAQPAAQPETVTGSSVAAPETEAQPETAVSAAASGEGQAQ